MTLPTRLRALRTYTPARHRVLTDKRLTNDDRFLLMAVMRSVTENA